MSEELSAKIKGKVKMLSGLKPYKGVSTEELIKIATEQEERKLDEIDVVGKFIDKKERKLAGELLNKYLSDYTIETISDRNTLKDIIYLEILNLRIQNKLNDVQDTDNAVPPALVDVIHKNLDALTKLKLTLGIAHRKDEHKDGYTELEKLKKKFKIWREHNQGTRTMVCPHCAKMIMMKIRMDAWETQQHPFFKDRILTNKHLVYLLKTGKIDRDDVAKVLETSPDYIDWLIEKWYKDYTKGDSNGDTELVKESSTEVSKNSDTGGNSGDRESK